MFLQTVGSVYLGHIISAQGVRLDPEKIEVLNSWLEPKTVKNARSFLGFTGYYRRFIQHYVQLTSPLIDVLRKDCFCWDEGTRKAFRVLQEKIMTTPILSYPNFDLPFTIETDACDVRVGVILLQEEHPISFYSKKLSPLWQRASPYAKELWAITNAMHKWRHYLLGHDPTIRNDHRSLKNLLNQTIQTSEQQFFLTKLLGYQYTIVYKKGKENQAADALSHCLVEESSVGGGLMVLVQLQQPKLV